MLSQLTVEAMEVMRRRLGTGKLSAEEAALTKSLLDDIQYLEDSFDKFRHEQRLLELELEKERDNLLNRAALAYLQGQAANPSGEIPDLKGCWTLARAFVQARDLK